MPARSDKPERSAIRRASPRRKMHLREVVGEEDRAQQADGAAEIDGDAGDGQDYDRPGEKQAVDQNDEFLMPDGPETRVEAEPAFGVSQQDSEEEDEPSDGKPPQKRARL
eukprot:8443056-Pyramimonas_sp.AAC.1